MTSDTGASAVEVTSAAASAPLARRGRYRWVICLLLFLVTANNFMDRQTFSIAAPVIASGYKLSNSDIATIANAFLIAYSFGQFLAGLFVDWLGPKAGFTLAVACWSAVSALTSLGRGVISFSIFRFALRLSEGVNQPGGVKVAAEWFPPKELATAVGLIQSGSSIGMMIVPPIAAYLIVHFGWKAAFVLIALPGFAWIPLWRIFYEPLQTSRRVGEAERCYNLEERNARSRSEHDQGKITWWRLARQRVVLGVALARFFEEPAGWFYFTWLAIYLKNFRDVSLIHTGLLLTIPMAGFDVGKIGGGWGSSRLMKCGWSLDWSRKAVMLMSAVCMLAAIPAVMAHSPLGFVLLVSVATFGHGCWATTTQTIPGDVVAPRWVGTVYGITAFGGGSGAVIFMYVTGKLVDMHGSFTVPFVIAGLLPMVGFIAFSLLAGQIKPLRFSVAPGER